MELQKQNESKKIKEPLIKVSLLLIKYGSYNKSYIYYRKERLAILISMSVNNVFHLVFFLNRFVEFCNSISGSNYQHKPNDKIILSTFTCTYMYPVLVSVSRFCWEFQFCCAKPTIYYYYNNIKFVKLRKQTSW